MLTVVCEVPACNAQSNHTVVLSSQFQFQFRPGDDTGFFMDRRPSSVLRSILDPSKRKRVHGLLALAIYQEKPVQLEDL